MSVDTSSEDPLQSVSIMTGCYLLCELTMYSVDFMAHCRGSKDDWNRFARVTGDQGWSWNAILPYAYKVSPASSNISK